MTKIVVAVNDLMFAARIEDAAREAGATPVVVQSTETLDDALAGAAGAIVDLHDTAVDPGEVIRRTKLAGGGVLAFGRHTDIAALRAARAAGADTVVARSQLVEELPSLIRQVLAHATTNVDDVPAPPEADAIEP